jgi:2-polyprenyl-3-methyl-5-hydroxy-6-metoxy-1,4-benzoquinol methylase
MENEKASVFDPGYYANTRPEVLALVPASARFVVDVGCGAGRLGQALKAARPGIQVRGVEPVASQADLARRVLDDVFLGSAEDPLPAHWPQPDCVIFADVLEHLVDPWSLVKRYRDVLRPGGACVASIPNVTNREVLIGLLKHRWDYAPYGLLDRTHLRFFTRETAVELFENAGFDIQTVQRVLQIGRKVPMVWLRNAIDKESGRDRLYPPPLSNLIDAWTYQFLLVAS